MPVSTKGIKYVWIQLRLPIHTSPTPTHPHPHTRTHIHTTPTLTPHTSYTQDIALLQLNTEVNQHWIGTTWTFGGKGTVYPLCIKSRMRWFESKKNNVSKVFLLLVRQEFEEIAPSSWRWASKDVYKNLLFFSRTSRA